ncbi:MAG: exonuclease [Thermomicrobiales bacterium]|nr:exonuclease [Thermomicrobiales bacterium]
MTEFTRFIESVFEPGGFLSEVLPGYESRPGQLDMALRVAESLEHGDTLIAEAGTGIGKSLAYLVPAAWWALTAEEPVIVSTYTRALQEQLILKDVPVAQRVMRRAQESWTPNAVTLKGRANYLCRERWQAEVGRRGPDPELAGLVQRLKPWVAETKTGDKAELALSERDDRLFARLSASTDNCSNTVCRMNQGQKCFFARARSAAQKADLVVVNHALLFSDQGAGGTVLPATTRLIVDEAHHLEAAATRQFSYRLTVESIARHVDGLVEVKGTAAEGVLPTAVGMLAGAGAFVSSAEQSSDALGRVRSSVHDVDRLTRNTRLLFDRIHEAFDALASSGESSARIQESTRRLPDWSEVEIAADDLVHDLKSLEQHAQWLERTLSKAVNDKLLGEPGETALAAVSAWIEENALMTHRVSTAFIDPDANGVYWIERQGPIDGCSFNAAPLDVGEWIAGSVFADKETIVLTSATLTVNDSFQLFRKQSGIAEATELVAPSPFDYASSALVYVVSDIPEPSQRDYQQRVDEVIGSVGLALEGRTLALFTSHRHLREAAAALRGPLGDRGIEVLAQGVDAPPQELAERLRLGDRIVVLGAQSMWEGIDIPGQGLSGLIVVRLPFDVPSDPLIQARSELFAAPFYEYSVPRAVLRFRQGFGRLIRSTEDRGVCVLLDRRVIAKSYGRSFLKSLPGCRVERGPMSEVGAVAREWVEGAGAASSAAEQRQESHAETGAPR